MYRLDNVYLSRQDSLWLVAEMRVQQQPELLGLMTPLAHAYPVGGWLNLWLVRGYSMELANWTHVQVGSGGFGSLDGSHSYAWHEVTLATPETGNLGV